MNNNTHTYCKAKLTYTIQGIDYEYIDLYRFDNNYYGIDNDHGTEVINSDLLDYLECNRGNNLVSDYNITIDTISKENYFKLSTKLEELTELKIKIAHLNKEIEKLEKGGQQYE